MPVEHLIASDETKDFFKELPMPKGINGNEVNGKLYWEIVTKSSKNFNDLAIATETLDECKIFMIL